MATRNPIGRVQQFDPYSPTGKGATYTDEAGNYYAGDPLAGGSYSSDNLTFLGNDLASFWPSASVAANTIPTNPTQNTTPTNGQLSTSYDAGGNYSYAPVAAPVAPAPVTDGSAFLPGGSLSIPATALKTTPQRISPSTFASNYRAPNAPNPSLISDTLTIGADASNGYGGVTYAGFSPQDHQGVALGDPMNAKYALQQFLVQTGMDLGGNAQAIAQQLNAKYGAAYGDPNFFHAVDGETIMMPDGQYVHAAPNGYGLAAGTYNPQNTREVFWGYTDDGSGGSGGGGTTSGGGGSTTPSAGSSGSGGTGGGGTGGGIDFSSLLAQLQGLMGPQPTGPALPGGFNPNGAPITDGVNQVGNTPLDDLMTSALAGILQNGGTPYSQSIETTLADLISRGGLSPATERQLIGARDAEAGAFSGQLNDARAALAARGLGSVPGAGQGPEVTAIGRISDSLAPVYASAVSDIESHAIDVGNDSVMQALQMATGMSAQDTNAILNAIGTGTARQTALSNIALQTLDRNIEWNKFLAEFGLERDQIAEQLAQGRITSLVPLLQMFLQLAGQSAQGYIGNDN